MAFSSDSHASLLTQHLHWEMQVNAKQADTRWTIFSCMGIIISTVGLGLTLKDIMTK